MEEAILLEKQAGLDQEMGTAARRFFNPVKGVAEGWAESAGTHGLKELDAGGTKLLKEQGGSHLFNPSVPLSQAAKQPGAVRGVAEELSRRGWTGKGTSGLRIPFTKAHIIPKGFTKYLPVGQKGLMAGFGLGFGVPSIYQAYKRGPVGPTGEGGFAETGLGELTGNAAFIAAGRLGWIPGLAMYMGGSSLGGKAGRVIDRLRSGATLRQAISAPSPTEAQEQLANISENYSYGNA